LISVFGRQEEQFADAPCGNSVRRSSKIETRSLTISPRALLPVFLLLLAANAQQPKKPVPLRHTFEISGTVVNAITAEPVPHAEVSIGVSEQQSTLESTFTTTDGHFTFPDVAPAKYWLIARAHGFMRQGLDEHGNYFTGVAVGPGQNSQALTFRLRPDGLISGNITDSNGEPVADAQVMLFRTSSEEGQSETVLRAQTATDDQGAYRFSHLTPGKYFVAVSAQPWYARAPNQGLRTYVKISGQADADASTASSEPENSLDVAYPVTFYPGVTDPASASAIDLPPGDRDTADISLNAVPAVHISVQGPSSKPGEFGSATLLEAFGNTVIHVPAQGAIDPSGGFEISGFAPGHYVVDLESAGKVWKKSLDVAGNAEIDASESSPGVSLRGSVLFDGKPVPKAVVRLVNHESTRSFSAETSESGEFQFAEPALDAGTYEVSVVGVPDSAASGISATGAKVQGRSLQIADASSVVLTITMTKALARVQGIAQLDGKPKAGAMIVLVPQKFESNTSLIRRDQSDSDGTFALRHVLPGKYTIVAIDEGWNLEWLNPAVLQPYLKAGIPLDVVPGRKYALKVKVQ
jgi:Carboxypeptidase regulatory-like domain